MATWNINLKSHLKMLVMEQFTRLNSRNMDRLFHSLLHMQNVRKQSNVVRALLHLLGGRILCAEDARLSCSF